MLNTTKQIVQGCREDVMLWKRERENYPKIPLQKSLFTENTTIMFSIKRNDTKIYKKNKNKGVEFKSRN